MKSIWEAAKTPPVLATKLYVPAQRSNLVLRQRLTERLEASLKCKLTLISAPAGFGKTTLLSVWAQEHQHRLAWLSLDASDNDPVRFWNYIIAALQSLDHRLGVDAASLLHSQPSGQIFFEHLLTCLINEIDSTGSNDCPLLLVLDDFHVIKSQVINQALTFLLDHQPSQLHLILTSRADPHLPLSRLRAKNQLVELRAADLRFTRDETAEFLTRVLGLGLSSEQMAALDARTEGWIVGLQLAALSMRNRRNLSGFIAAFTGSNRYILDYLVEEVLQQQPAEIQNFLLQTCILDRMCAPLCDTVMGQTSSDQILASLDSTNLFLVPLDDERYWYRYHHLFAQFLRHHLEQKQRAQIPELYRRAAQWCEVNELGGDAISYALASKDHELAAHLVEQYSTRMLLRGEFITVDTWLSALPVSLVRARVGLALALAWTHLLSGRLDKIDSSLEDVERTLLRVSESDRRLRMGEVTAIRAFVTTYGGNPKSTIELCERALEQLPSDARMLRSMLGLSLGSAYVFDGNLQRADTTLSVAIRLAREEHIDLAHYATACLMTVENLRGRLRRIAELYQLALEQASQSGQEHALALGQILVAAGDLLREWNNLDSARPYLEEGIVLAERSGNSIAAIHGHFSLAQLMLAQGALENAMTMIARIEETARQTQIPHIAIQARTDCTRIYLAAGKWQSVSAWLATRGRELRIEWTRHRLGELTPVLEFEYITFARALLATGRNQKVTESLHQALQLLNDMLFKAEQAGRFGRVIEMRVIQAMVLDAMENRSMALTSLEHAIEMAAQEGYVRLFVDEGEPMRVLLMESQLRIHKRESRAHLSAYVDKLLSSFSMRTEQSPVETPNSQLSEPLSERELEILKLIANDDSNQEIAQKLYLTVGTVKWHVNHILGKLNARNRHDAVKRAQLLNLLR